MIEKAIANQIRSIAGKENVFEDKETRICYSYDATNLKYLPDLIVYPANREQISAVVKLANEFRFPVIPRGAGTGFTGGTLPVAGGVVLVLTKMNKILPIAPHIL